MKNVRLNIAVEQNNKSFLKLKIKVRDKIVADGLEDSEFDVTQCGVHVDAQSFNDLISKPETLLVDMRNHYESEIGHFEGAITPDVDTFRDSLPLIEEDLQSHKKDKNIVMYCTGGIRCEKATNYLLKQGFEEVYHLDGGILKYLETVDKDESLWSGECFVFDERVSVDENLAPGKYISCFGCRTPLSEAEIASPHYQLGVSCPHCYGKHSAAKVAGLKERQKQMELAEARKDGDD